MSWRGFEYCCGIGEIGSFDGMHNLKESIQAAIDEARKLHKGAVIATTINGQQSAIKALEELNFLPVAKFRNPNTSGTQVTLWYRPTSDIAKGKTLRARLKEALI